MGKLGIAIKNDTRQNENLALSYPLLAFSYSRSGFIRLAGKKFKIRK
ncbi:MAG: hypothetical protein HZB23_08395 [Deltaproteobacteria bacterium]|nr:hypothetical protein [Deltaproteobacteria bacterium]